MNKEKRKPQPNQNTTRKWKWRQRQNHKPASGHRQPKQPEVAITETKGTPPALEGYAPWYHRPRGEGDGGGVAITVRNNIKQNTQLVDDLENNNNQEIIWI